jgi:hypothetical protein
VEEECMGNFRDRNESYDGTCERLGITNKELEEFKGERCRIDYDRKSSDKRCEKCGDRHFPWCCEKYRYSAHVPRICFMRAQCVRRQ